jgi:hypothetical protein
MAGDEVRVKVGEEDVADLEAKFLGIVQVLLDIALGVDDDGGRAGLISEQIRSVGEAAQVVRLRIIGISMVYHSATSGVSGKRSLSAKWIISAVEGRKNYLTFTEVVLRVG